MTKVIGVRFREAGKVYYFDPLDMVINRGDNVIVVTTHIGFNDIDDIIN